MQQENSTQMNSQNEKYETKHASNSVTNHAARVQLALYTLSLTLDPS